jgi:hypothetical protein
LKKNLILLIGAMFLVITFTSISEAALVQYSDREAFSSHGTIVYNYGFEDYTGSSFYFPGDPWTTHGVIYTTGKNLIVVPSLGYGNVSNVFAYTFWTPLTATIASPYTMFALDLGYESDSGDISPINFIITTNLGTYNFNNLSVPNINQGMSFFGFITEPGEYFKGFILSSTLGIGNAPMIDNVTLGNTAPVPVPTAILLFGSGLLGFVGIRRRIKS